MLFSFGHKEIRGIESDRAEHSEVKTSQCDVFRESVDETYGGDTRRIKRCRCFRNNKLTVFSAKKHLDFSHML